MKLQKRSKLEIKRIISLLICISTGALFAQEKGLNSVQNTTINPKIIQLDSADRLFSQATDYVSNVTETPQTVTFDYGYKPYVYTKNLSTVAAIYKLKIDKVSDAKKGLVRAGMGNYMNTMLDVYYGSMPNKHLAWSINANHLGALNGPVAKRLSGYSDNKLGVQAKYFTKNYCFFGSANYQRTVTRNYLNAYNNFGFDKKKIDEHPSYQQIADSTIKNPANDFFFDLGASSINTQKAFQFDLRSMPHYFTLNDSTNEFAVKNSFLPTYKFKQGKVFLLTEFDYASLSQDSVKLNRTNFNIRPSFEHVSNDLRFIGEVGMAFNSSNDTTLDKKLSVYPFVKASYLLSNELGLMVKGKLTGGLVQQNLKDTYRQNGWLGSLNPNTINNKIIINTSLEAKPIQNLTTKVMLDYKVVENFNYFIPSTDSLGYFANRATKDPVNVLGLGLEVSYDFVAGHGVKLNLDYMNYTTDETLFYTPNMITSFEFYYKINKKLKLSSDISYISGLVNSSDKKMDAIVDLNIKGDYRFNEKLSAFITGNNLIGKKYQYFQGYSVQGINVLAGLTYNF